MANPNIAGLTYIYGHTHTMAVTTSWVTMLTTASGQISRINSIIVSNIDGTNDADINIQIEGYYIARSIAVPANSSLVVVSKDTGLYLTESQSMQCYASANSDLQLVMAYEQIY